MEEVRRYFAETLASEPGFALRESQIEMAEACAAAFYDEGMLLAEAGTGTGKTLAYLIPALIFRLKAQGEQIIISTQTLNLQSQILNSDIPRLGKNLGLEFKAVPARGRNNYLCLDRLYKLSGDMSLETGEIDIVNMINERLASAEEGLFNDKALELAGVHSEFSFVPAKFWSRICCDPFACRGARCRYFQRCFLFRERRELGTADIIITNHALVLADAAIRREGGQSILPSCARIVFDEAHHLEDAATSHLGSSFSKKETLRLFNHLGSFSQTHEQKGLITDLEMIISATPASPEYKAEMQEAANLLIASRLLPLNDKLSLLEEELIGLFPENEFKFSYDAEWISDSQAQHFLHKGKELAALMRETAADLKAQAEFLDEFPDWTAGADFKLELQSAEHLLADYAKALDFCLEPASPDWVFWAERTPSRNDYGNENFILKAVPLDIGQPLAELVLDPARTVIMTSATLSTNKSLGFIKKRLSLDIRSDIAELAVPSPFDYGTQTVIGVPSGIPPAESQDFWPQISQQLAGFITDINGRTLILATSWKGVREAYDSLAPILESRGMQMLCHGKTGPRHILLERFRDEEGTVLIGTDSFWEGVDVPGPALSCVIILRLPFTVPTDPVHKARCEKIDNAGGTSFTEYSLPLAAMKLRQGFGRLIRKIDDRGCVIILDSRIMTRHYGRHFRNSLPACPIIYEPLEPMLATCAGFIVKGAMPAEEFPEDYF